MNRFSGHWILTGVLLVFITGCSVNERVTHRSSLLTPEETGRIGVIVNDGTRYHLTDYTLVDSILRGSGTQQLPDGTDQEFRGDIPLHDIALVEARSTSTGATFLAIGLTVAFTTAAISDYGHDDRFTIVPDVSYHGPYYGGHSCPYIYSWTGSAYALDAEAFGVGLGKSLETTTRSILRSLREDNDSIRIRISDERSETHYVNSVLLEAAYVPDGIEAAVGTDGNVWPVASRVPPTSAHDDAGMDVVTQVSREDQVYWESSNWKEWATAGFQDTVECSFPMPPGSHTGSFLVQGLNTDFSGAAYNAICSFLGDQSAMLVYHLDHGTELAKSLSDWIDEASMKVFVQDGAGWREAGTIRPEANVAPFERLVRFTLQHPTGRSVKFRLVSLKDVWKIDALCVDWTSAHPLKTTALPLRLAHGPDGADVSTTIASADAKYVILTPPEHMDLTYAAGKPPSGMKPVYVVSVQGYLHEWIPEKSGKSVALWGELLPGNQRISYLEKVLHDKSLLLPPLYTEWAAMQQ